MVEVQVAVADQVDVVELQPSRAAAPRPAAARDGRYHASVSASAVAKPGVEQQHAVVVPDGVREHDSTRGEPVPVSAAGRTNVPSMSRLMSPIATIGPSWPTCRAYAARMILTRRPRLRTVIVGGVAVACVAAVLVPAAASVSGRVGAAADATWQYQLQGPIDTSVDADVYDVDLFEVPQSVIDELHADGRHVVCYLSAGSWERWRPDADDFPASVLGKKLDGWPGERWLDIRQIDVLGPIMAARLDLCAEKDFDAVEFDNVEGFRNPSGFPLSGPDQLAYNRWLADAAHERGLSVGLKNDLSQIVALEPDFDFAVNEQCFQYRECDRLEPFIEAGKNVIIVEYETKLEKFCDDAAELGAVAMRKKLSLKVWRQPCP